MPQDGHYGARDDVGDVIPSTAQQCAGVMIILVREKRFNDAMQIAHRLGMFDPANLDMEAPVYNRPPPQSKAEAMTDEEKDEAMHMVRARASIIFANAMHNVFDEFANVHFTSHWSALRPVLGSHWRR